MLITGFIGAGLLYTAVVSSESRVLFTVLGLFMLAVSVMMLLGQRRERASWRSIDLAGRPAWAMSLGGGAMAAAAAVVLTVLGVGLALVVVMGPNVGARVVSGVLALFVLVVAGTMWGVVLRRPELRISADLVQLRGPGSTRSWPGATSRSSPTSTSGRGGGHSSSGPRRVLRRTTTSSGARCCRPTGCPTRPGSTSGPAWCPTSPAVRRLLAALHLAGRDGRESMIARGLPEASGH